MKEAQLTAIVTIDLDNLIFDYKNSDDGRQLQQEAAKNRGDKLFGALFSLLDEVLENTRVIQSRAYQDFNHRFFRQFPHFLQKKYRVEPIQCFNVGNSKNAADMVMTIDMLDNTAKYKPDCYVIVAGDADFTPALNRLKSLGIYTVVIAPDINGSAGKTFITQPDEYHDFDWFFSVNTKISYLRDVNSIAEQLSKMPEIAQTKVIQIPYLLRERGYAISPRLYQNSSLPSFVRHNQDELGIRISNRGLIHSAKSETETGKDGDSRLLEHRQISAFLADTNGWNLQPDWPSVGMYVYETCRPGGDPTIDEKTNEQSIGTITKIAVELGLLEELQEKDGSTDIQLANPDLTPFQFLNEISEWLLLSISSAITERGRSVTEDENNAIELFASIN